MNSRGTGDVHENAAVEPGGAFVLFTLQGAEKSNGESQATLRRSSRRDIHLPQ